MRGKYMKNAKYIISGIITIFIGIVVYQNQTFFFSFQQLSIDLWFIDKYESSYFYNGLFLLACFLLGLLAAYLFGLFEKYKLNKTIKNLNAAVTAKEDRISFLENEIEHLKIDPLPAEASEVDIPEHETEALPEDIDNGDSDIAVDNESPGTEAGESPMEMEDTIVEADEAEGQTEDKTVKPEKD